jgi:hypothetical protein
MRNYERGDLRIKTIKKFKIAVALLWKFGPFWTTSKNLKNAPFLTEN